MRFESHCNFLLLVTGVAMQQRHHLLMLSKGVQADTTNYFVVWWVLFECSSFDYFVQSILENAATIIDAVGLVQKINVASSQTTFGSVASTLFTMALTEKY